jgi:hypothetical protein
MRQSSPLAEAVYLLDCIIDDSLDCQEQLYRQKLKKEPDFEICLSNFATRLEKIISVKYKVSTAFYS